jgi:23S rRNA pseudouridine1911/1915/1917 synthase
MKHAAQACTGAAPGLDMKNTQKPRDRDAAARPKRAAQTEPMLPPGHICQVLHSDEHLVVVDKRAGFPVAPMSQYQERSVLRVLQKLGFGTCYPVSLLDREATGLVLLSRDPQTARSMRWNWRSSLCERKFIAVAQGVINGARGRVTLPIGVVQTGKTRRRGVLAQDQGGRSAETRWKLLARGRGMSRLLVTLGAGRCHQIRIHLAAIGHPVVNDSAYIERNMEATLDQLLEGTERKYEIIRLPPQQIGLHLWRIKVPHPATGEICTFEAPIPRELLDLMPGAWIVDEA